MLSTMVSHSEAERPNHKHTYMNWTTDTDDVQRLSQITYTEQLQAK